MVTVRRHVWLWLAVLLGLLLRLTWVLTQSTHPGALEALPDQGEYLAIAHNLSHGLGMGFYDARFQSWLLAYRMPGYPLFLAACGGSIPIIRMVQAIVDTSTIVAAYLLAGCCFGSFSRHSPQTPGGEPTRIGSDGNPPAIAALLVAFNPFLIYFCGLILSETLFVAMLIWGMWLLTRNSFALTTAGRTLLALSILVRPSALLLPVALAVVAPMLRGRRPNSADSETYAIAWRGVFASLLWMCFWIGLTITPWAIRNHRPDVLGRWIFLTTNGGITAYDGMNPRADGSSNQWFVRRMPELRQMDEVSRSDYLQQLARNYARSHPWRAIQLSFLKVARLWSPAPLSESFSNWRYQLIALLYSVTLDGLALAGLIMRRLGRGCKVFLVIAAIYFTAIHALTVGSLRYRLPVEAPMAILGASVFMSARATRAASTVR